MHQLPDNTEEIIAQGNALRQAGDPSGAMAALQQVAPGDDLAGAAQAFLALALHDDGKADAALRTALHALALHLPAYSEAVTEAADALVAPERPRVIAVGMLIRDGWILAEEYPGHDGSEPFLRVPGGGVEFAETADDAIRREFTEELAAHLDHAELVGITENIFTRGTPPHLKRGHEIVYAYRIRSASLEALPFGERLPVQDADTTVGWYRLDSLGVQSPPLYPLGVLDLLID